MKCPYWKSNAGLWCIVIFTTVASPVFSELPSATDYFNYGSATFIREDPQKALAIVLEGLEHYPEHDPLIRLKELLEQQQEQNQQNQQDQQESQENDQSPEDGDNEQNDDESDQNRDNDPNDTSEQEEQQPPEPLAEEMTEDEAEMVLDSLRQLEQAQREQLMREIIRRQLRDMPPVEKDW
ncbi:MAG TPA: hypothetical protein PJ991_01645 [Kiritimatiellia bacterium]|nr:hypothetical protein [Kiritimatiellia bacterium]